MKPVISIVILVGLVAAGFVGWKKLSSSTEPAQEQSAGNVAPVETKNIDFSVNVAGEIVPAEQVSVRPEVNGKIKEMPVDIGDRVSKGDLLFSLDDTDIMIDIESQMTEIAAAQLNLDQAKRTYERNKHLFEEDLISEDVYENSLTQYNLALNAIERAQTNLDLAEDRLSRTKITAPFDCTILTRPVSVGQAVSGSGGFNAGTEVFTIANLSDLIINAHVNQADVTRLQQDMEVDISVEAVPGLTVKGIIQRIAPQATIINNIKGFSCRIQLRDIDPRIQPGMTANVSIPVASAENVMAIPLAAVFSEQGARYVYVKDGQKFIRKDISIGISDFFHAEVLSGLNGNEQVAITPPDPKDIVDTSTPGKGALAGTSPSKNQI